VLFAGVCMAAPNALIIQDGTIGTEASIVSNLTTKLTTAGYTVSTETVTPGNAVPSPISSTYAQVWDVRFSDGSAISSADSATFVAYLAAGGRLFVDGENTGSSPGRDASIASLVASAGGGTITPTAASNLETVYVPFTGPSGPVTSITFNGAAGSLTTGSGFFITQNLGDLIGAAIVWPLGTLSSAPAGVLIVVFDSDFMTSAADANSQALLANLIGYLYSTAPYITNLNPNSGPVGTSVIISGGNFGATQGASTVKFNGTTATPTSWSATSITANVPTGATTGNVIVTVGGQASNGVLFTVTAPAAPTIISLNPTLGPVASSVIISGTNFGATQSTSTVTFNGTTATATSWSATSITATVPTGALTGNVVVTVGGQASNGVNFTGVV
jgi:uncharacterized protein (TIGR03437 family)